MPRRTYFGLVPAGQQREVALQRAREHDSVVPAVQATSAKQHSRDEIIFPQQRGHVSIYPSIYQYIYIYLTSFINMHHPYSGSYLPPTVLYLSCWYSAPNRMLSLTEACWIQGI